MPKKYDVGDEVLVLKDEGFDLPDEVQGKIATIVEIEGNNEYIIAVGNYTALAAYYHLKPLKEVKDD